MQNFLNFYVFCLLSSIMIRICGSIVREREGTIPTKPRSRSVPDVTDTKFAKPLQVRSLSADVFQGASFGIVPSSR